MEILAQKHTKINYMDNGKLSSFSPGICVTSTGRIVVTAGTAGDKESMAGFEIKGQRYGGFIQGRVFISDNGGTLESDNQANYQWYLNGNELPGETQQNHVYTQSGTYQVGTVILGNCPTLSNEIVIQITGIVEREIALETNSNGTQLRSRDELNNVTVEWYDGAGRMVNSERFASIKSNQDVTIQRPIFTGMKLLRLTSNETVKTWKLY